MNKKDILVDFLLRGFKGINELTENIDFQKTTKQFLKSQLPNEINNSFLKIQFSNNSNHIEETFFDFLKDNDQFFVNLKLYNLDGKQETLQQLITEHFQNIHSKYNEDKLFFFYFQLILMDIFLSDKNIQMPRQDLKEQLMEILKNHCFIEKRDFSKCLGQHMDDIDVVAMSDFNDNIKKHCEIPKSNLEKCVMMNWKKKAE
jgi:GTP-sensing pleiotropic transcriptional regulator CodY